MGKKISSAPVPFLGAPSVLQMVTAFLTAHCNKSRATTEDDDPAEIRESNAARTAATVFALPLPLQEGNTAVSLPVWVFNDESRFSPVHHLLLSKRCSACVVWFDSSLDGGRITNEVLSCIHQFRRCLPRCDGPPSVVVHLATVESTSTPHHPVNCDAIVRSVRAVLDDPASHWKGSLRMKLQDSVISVNGASFNALTTAMEQVARANIELMKERHLMRKVKKLESKLDEVREDCSRPLTTWDEFKDVAEDICRNSDDEELRAVVRASGHLILVERNGWPVMVIVSVPDIINALSKLLCSDELRRRHSQYNVVTTADTGEVLDDLPRYMLQMFIGLLEEMLIAYTVGESICEDDEVDLRMPWLATVYRPADKWLGMMTSYAMAYFDVPCPEFFDRVQVALAGTFGTSSVWHWKDSCRVTSRPRALVATSRCRQYIAWEVAGHDTAACNVLQKIQQVIREQSSQHMPFVCCTFANNIPEQEVARIIEQSTDGSSARLGDLANEIRQVRDAAAPSYAEELGVCAGGDIQKYPIRERDVPVHASQDTLLHIQAAIISLNLEQYLQAPLPEYSASGAPSQHVCDANRQPAATAATADSAQCRRQQRAAASPTEDTTYRLDMRGAAGIPIGAPQRVALETPAKRVQAALYSLGTRSDDEDDDNYDDMPLTDGVEFSPCQDPLIAEMTTDQRCELARICDGLDGVQGRGCTALLCNMGFKDPHWESQVRENAGPGTTLRILDRAVERGFRMRSLLHAMGKSGNKMAVDVISDARESILADQLGRQDSEHFEIQSQEPPPPAYMTVEERATLTYPDNRPLDKFMLASYHWDSAEHAQNVENYVRDLWRRGQTVRMDAFEVEGIKVHPARLQGWKAEMYERADAVLVFGSPGFKRACMTESEAEEHALAHWPLGCGVRSEFTRLLRSKPLVPVLLSDSPANAGESWKQCFPVYMHPAVYYAVPRREEALLNRLNEMHHGQQKQQQHPVVHTQQHHPSSNGHLPSSNGRQQPDGHPLAGDGRGHPNGTVPRSYGHRQAPTGTQNSGEILSVGSCI
eukprot:scpid23049/ scgid4559/ 